MKNVPAEKRGQFGYGDVWKWIALDAETKLVPSWLVSTRDASAAYTFMMDMAARIASRVQLTTDGYRPYLEAVEGAFGANVDYAMLQKLYGSNPDEKRYSPAKIIGVRSEVMRGDSDPMHVSTTSSARISRCECPCGGSRG